LGEDLLEGLREMDPVAEQTVTEHLVEKAEQLGILVAVQAMPAAYQARATEASAR
jgi:hypothetical protein